MHTPPSFNQTKKLGCFSDGTIGNEHSVTGCKSEQTPTHVWFFHYLETLKKVQHSNRHCREIPIQQCTTKEEALFHPWRLHGGRGEQRLLRQHVYMLHFLGVRQLTLLYQALFCTIPTVINAPLQGSHLLYYSYYWLSRIFCMMRAIGCFVPCV